MIVDRLVSLMHRLTDKPVFAELLSPVERVLARVRNAQGLGRTLSMSDFIALGVLRHLQGMGTLREQVQTLLHLDPGPGARAPLARSTWSDALCSPARLGVLEETLPALVAEAAAVLPDRLADIPGLGTRPVRAIDGTDQGESAHARRCTPKAGGEDNPKGHALLSVYNLRLGGPDDVQVETRSRHETAILRDDDRSPPRPYPRAPDPVPGRSRLHRRPFLGGQEDHLRDHHHHPHEGEPAHRLHRRPRDRD